MSRRMAGVLKLRRWKGSAGTVALGWQQSDEWMLALGQQDSSVQTVVGKGHLDGRGGMAAAGHWHWEGGWQNHSGGTVV